MTGTEDELRAFLQRPWLHHFSWAACCFGATERSVLLEVVRQGGHVRLGFENNLELHAGEPASSNAALIETFVRALPPDAPPLAGARELRACFLGKTHQV